MNAGTDTTEDGDAGIVAAEYVLGVQDATVRAAAAQRIETDREFAQLVDGWEVSFAPLAAAYPPVAAPEYVKVAVDQRLFAPGAVAEPRSASFWSSLALWRGLTGAALAALVVVASLPYWTQPSLETTPRYVASLVADASDVRYVAFYEADQAKVSLAHLSGAKGDGRDFELWMIEGSAAPVSMGVLPVGETISITISPEARAKLAAGAVLAISLEPLGGSPTGQPTGPVVAAGDLKSI